MVSNKKGREIKELAEKARKLARKHSAPGCATDTFYGISEALKLKGRGEVYMATLGLSGGCGVMTRGTCGAISGGAAAIALSFGLNRKRNEELKKNPKNMVPFYGKKTPKIRFEIYNKILEVADKVKEKYGGTTCADIQFELYGQTLDLRDPRINEKFATDVQKCSDVEGDVAAWSVEAILKPSKWNERLREWEFPRTVIKRGHQFERESAGFKFPPRFKSRESRDIRSYEN